MIRICHPFVGDTVGGSHISALTLIRSLDASRFQPVVVLHEEGPLASYVRASRVPVRYVWIPGYVTTTTSRRHRLRLAGCLVALMWFISRNDIAIVHTHDRRMHLTWSSSVSSSKAKHVWHQRSCYVNGQYDDERIKYANEVIAISDAVARGLPAWVEDRTTRIVNPFEVSHHMPSRAEARGNLCRELGISERVAVVGWFANFSNQKRPMVFLDAAAEILRRVDRQVIFVMFGAARENTLQGISERAREMGIEAAVRLMGFRYPILPYIAACDVALVPAVGDAFGRTLVEAMLVGTPVVAADSGGHEEIIAHEETGLLATPDDAEAFAIECIRLLYEKDFAATLAGRARSLAEDRYGVSDHVKRVEAIYDALVAK